MTQLENLLKKCGKCLQEKERKEFYFDSHHNKLASRCKICVKASNSEYKKKNPEKAKEWRNAWSSRNLPKLAARNALRKAAQKQRTPPWLTKEHRASIASEYALAAWCSEVMNEPYHVDHVVPLQGVSVSGLHVPWNLQVIPASENLSKYNHHT